MRTTWLLLAALTTSLLCGAPADAADPSAAVQASAGDGRVIVKFRTGAVSLQPHVLSGTRSVAQASILGRRLGLPLVGGPVISDRTHVVTMAGTSSEALAAKLAQDSDVEYAVPDQRRHAFAAPNDPRYASGLGGRGPASGQWYLRAPAGAVQASIDAESAWAVTHGDPSVVVAVLDTGVRYDHPDLKEVVDGGNLLNGYDMVSDTTVANDGNGRDNDASDPGDWLTAAELGAGGAFSDCHSDPVNSSWHGTQTSGLIAAITDNGVGMASVGRTIRVLPVRVLGKCGGLDSDIIAGMRWAAGLPVAGLPENLNPANVINLSLGGSGACSRAYIDAIQEVTQAGALVVISAGNAGQAVSSPANCPGALAVAGLQHTGAKVGFSDLGPEVAISAPAGNCVTETGGCQYPILTTTNAGTTTPVANNASYTDGVNFSLGTSFSAPLVSATAALMLAAHPGLTPLQLRLLLQSSARPFATTGAITGTGSPPAGACTSPQYRTDGTPVDQLQCYCSTGTCGAGMLDAGAAVRAAAAASPEFKVHARIDVTPAKPLSTSAVLLSAANTVVALGHQVINHQWTLVDGGGIVSAIDNANAVEARVTPSGAGLFTVSLAVQDDAGFTSTTVLAVSVAEGAVTAASSGGGGGAVGGEWLLGLFAGTVALLALRRRRPAAARVSR